MGDQAWGQWTDQQLSLTSGWNSVFLNVDPFPAGCDELFGDEPRITSVRKWNPLSPDDVQYDETAGAVLPDGGSWLTWFPTNHPDRSLLDLDHLVGGAAYLIEVEPGDSISMGVTGRPIVTHHRWKGGVFHFAGLPVPSSPLASFTDFFSPAQSTIPVRPGRGGEIYQVQPDGSHQQILRPTLTKIEPGRPYWIKAALPTDYTGPISVSYPWPSGYIDFGNRLTPQYVEIRNETDEPRTIRIQHDPSGPPPPGAEPIAGQVPLRFAVVQPTEKMLGRIYEDLPPAWTNEVPAGESIRLAFLPEATQLTSADTNSTFQSILTITDDVSDQGTIEQRFGVRVASRSGDVADSKGLWVGTATITDVARVQMAGLRPGTPVSPIPVHRPFTFRLIVHVDTNGTPHLVQRVLVGTRRDVTTDDIVTDLLADESNVPTYRAEYPDTKIFRVSSANFPFMDPVELTGGDFAVPNKIIRGIVSMPWDDPVNPFLHASAPLHDNQDRRAGKNEPHDGDVEVFSVDRHIELLFQPPDENSPDPTWGISSCGGIYREELYGLGGLVSESNRVVKVEGTFRLERALTTGELTR